MADDSGVNGGSVVFLVVPQLQWLSAAQPGSAALPRCQTTAHGEEHRLFTGHEISHTFDIEGSAVDSTGRVRNWWKPADLAHFQAATASLVAQYDAYKPLPDLAVNGKQTLDENIANLGGFAAAYDAYHASLAGKTTPPLNGLSGDQQVLPCLCPSPVLKVE